MMQIWKESTPKPSEMKTLPGRVLHVAGGFVWFESEGRETKVRTFGTGWDIQGEHVGTWSQSRNPLEGPFVWHLMDVTDAEKP